MRSSHYASGAIRNQKLETKNQKPGFLAGGRRRDGAAAKQAREHALHLAVDRHLTVRCEVVDEQREHPRDRGRSQVRIDAMLLRELLDKLAAEHLFDLLGGNGKILT